jgi:NAD(P)-dependent dehydrogenase (short-subunit alcohol dehydrogenase family)
VDLSRLRNRIAVVTGGSSGIGFAAARLLLDDGVRVAICGRGQWCEELNLKVISQIRPVRAFRHLQDASDAPAIVGVNAILSFQPEPHMVCTSSARAGVQNLQKSPAAEFAPKIRVNTAVPGLAGSGEWQRRFEVRDNKGQSREDRFAALTKDKHIPLGRLGRPDEAARAIVFLGLACGEQHHGRQSRNLRRRFPPHLMMGLSCPSPPSPAQKRHR